EVRANDRVLGHGCGPIGDDIIGVIVRCPADRPVDLTLERSFGDLDRTAPPVNVRLSVQRSVTGEGELASGGARRPFVDDPADACREGWMADPVQDNLGDRAFTILVLIAGFII